MSLKNKENKMSSPKKKYHCDFCDKPGHKQSFCFKYKEHIFQEKQKELEKIIVKLKNEIKVNKSRNINYKTNNQITFKNIITNNYNHPNYELFGSYNGIDLMREMIF